MDCSAKAEADSSAASQGYSGTVQWQDALRRCDAAGIPSNAVGFVQRGNHIEATFAAHAPDHIQYDATEVSLRLPIAGLASTWL